MNYAIILSAGKGERMKRSIPKCAIPILGVPMVQYIIDEVSALVDDTYVVLGHKSEEFNFLRNVKIAYQDNQIGSADACKSVINNISDKGFTIIIPGDVPLINKNLLTSFINYHLDNNYDLTVLSSIRDNPYGYGRIIKNENKLIRITEEIECNEDEKKIKEVNSGIICIKNEFLDFINKIDNKNKKGEYYLTDIVDVMKNYNIASFIGDNNLLLGVNTPLELNKAEEYIRNKINEDLLNKGVILENKSSITISKDSIIEQGVTIKQGSYIINSKINKCSIIGPNSQIINSYIGESTNINQSVIVDSKINEFCNVGPFSHIRDNSNIGISNRIGNFVEIKNTSTKKNTKASHLAYIGDTQCGENVNFGCGVITVNYNGKEKNKTIIEDNCFIGCNSNLIAPLVILKGSYIAAGTTLTKYLDEYDFAISRSELEIKKGYAKKYE